MNFKLRNNGTLSLSRISTALNLRFSHDSFVVSNYQIQYVII